jgi:predicted nucleotidyltransferase
VTPDALGTTLRRDLPRLVPGLAAAYLFGSRARNEATPASDVDVALLYERAPASTLMARPFFATSELESILGQDVDLVVLNDAPRDLVHRVLRDGILVFEADRGARIAFEVKARNEYFDLLPTLERYWQTGRR